MTRLGWLALGAGGMILGVYALVLLALYLLQDALIFPVPDRGRPTLDRWAAELGVEPIALTASDGVPLYGWHARGDGSRGMLVFHGNGGDASIGGWFAQQLPGMDVVSISYRGYPGSGGAPSEAGMELDARAAWVYLTETVGIPPERVVIHGQSMGGGVALMLADEVQPAGIVLDSTFCSILEVASGRVPLVPVSLLLRNPFRSDLRAPNVRAPVLVLHGDDDRLIPVAQGRRLATLLPDATYVELPGWGHHTWLLDHPDADAAWRGFLARILP